MCRIEKPYFQQDQVQIIEFILEVFRNPQFTSVTKKIMKDRVIVVNREYYLLTDFIMLMTHEKNHALGIKNTELIWELVDKYVTQEDTEFFDPSRNAPMNVFKVALSLSKTVGNYPQLARLTELKLVAKILEYAEDNIELIVQQDAIMLF